MKIIGEKERYISSSEIGGKAKGLLFLHQNGFKVPTFYLLDYSTIKTIQTDTENLSSIVDQWKASYSIEANQLWAVRSSTAMEDGKEKSFAGQFVTRINVKTTDLNRAIFDVLNSYSIQSDYAEKSDSHGIVIQEMISPDYSGVLFTKDPVNLLNDNCVINLTPGLGEKMVTGELDACQVRFKEDEFVFEELEKSYEGEKFEDNQLHTSVEIGETIKSATEPHLRKLVEGSYQLEKIIEAPADVEFVIKNGEVFWLQVRPMTNRSLNEKLVIWDNTNAEGNYPGLTLPLSISFTQITFEGAYSASARSIGFKKKILDQNRDDIKNMSGGINGALYYNVGAWQSNLYQMPFGKKFVRLLPRIWGMADAPFVTPAKRHSFLERSSIFFNLLFKLFNSKQYEKRYEDNISLSLNKYSDKELTSKSFDDLIISYWDLRNGSANNWLAPILNGFYTMLIFFRLKRYIRKSKLVKTHPNFLNDILFAEGDVISVELVKSFQSLLHEISQNDDLRELFDSNEPDQIKNRLETEYSEFHQKIMSYIGKYGERTSESELKMETVNYKQDPLLFIQYIKTNAKRFVKNESKGESFDYNKVLKTHYPYNFIKRFIFKRLINIAVRRVKARENYRYTRTQVFALFRQIFLQMGDRLTSKGHIETSRDVLYLRVDELLDEKKQNQFKAIIEQRKKDYLDYSDKHSTVRYIQSEKGLYEAIDDTVVIAENQLKGIGCCSGIVEGKLVVINKDTDFNQDFTDCILVSHYFEPGWISLFSQAKGIISERGNLLSHTSIICRELNVPSIVGVKGLISALDNKESLKMNGATGVVYLDLDE